MLWFVQTIRMCRFLLKDKKPKEGGKMSFEDDFMKGASWVFYAVLLAIALFFAIAFLRFFFSDLL